MRVFCSASRNDTRSLTLRSPTIAKISSTSCGARPIDGSSNRIIFGCAISARPIAAGGIARLTRSPYLEPREIRVHELEIALQLGATDAAGEGARQQIFLDREVLEAVA